MSKLKLGILFGGRSEEHPISVKSAREIARHLDLDIYEPYFVGISREGDWRLCEEPSPDWAEKPSRPAVLSTSRSIGGLLVFDEDSMETIQLDVIMPVLHGRYGEDGTIQGLLDLTGIPYVGCGVASSALCMDKALAYAVVRSSGIATPTVTTLTGRQTVDPTQFCYPVFVKPARSGSSFGVSKVSNVDDLPAAVETARRYDTKVLIEEAVCGQEIGCAVLGNPDIADDLLVGEVDHIELSHGFFRIHQEENPEEGSDNSTTIVPADIPAESRTLVQEAAKAIYRVLGCEGLARVDVFLTENGDVVLNEVNTFPGMTSYSRYPRMMAAAGWTLDAVINKSITLALKRAK